MTVPSPCIRNCCLDDEDVCLGCFRTVEDIICWADSSENEKLQILHVAEKRKLERIEKYKNSLSL